MSDKIDAVITDIIRENDEILRIELANANGAELPQFECGAHIDLHLPNGLIRQYSLWAAPGDNSRYHIAVKREVNSRGGSEAVHAMLSIGDSLKISVPRNNFALDPNGSHAILLAAGIGITPLMSMALHLQANGKLFELHYFSRAPEVTAFADLIANSALAENTTHYYGQTAEAVQSTLQQILQPRPTGTHVYLCGPSPFIDAVKSITAAHWPENTVHFEHFSAEKPVLTAGGDGFELYLAQSDKTFTVPSDQSIADVLTTNGIEVELSCEQGICGTCLTRVVDGIPDHEDMYLSDAEHALNDQMTICVSRCKSPRLVLDL
ncbi:PDR/VanB family oxidoreductase [Pararhodobacter oceanensis]|uniref:PDR/VanB family oxidoreductase n=1 Tax=Pararhodobacter oceanensis TaxID=2172121 RepID=UPI003A91B47F